MSVFWSVLKCVVVCGRGCVHSPKCENRLSSKRQKWKPFLFAVEIEMEEVGILFVRRGNLFCFASLVEHQAEHFWFIIGLWGKHFAFAEEGGERAVPITSFIVKIPFLFFPFVGS